MTEAPQAVRSGEELDIEALRKYLRPHVDSSLDELSVSQFPGGHSNLTYMLKAGALELVLRRPPFGAKIATGHDMAREHQVLEGLARAGKAAPKPIAFCGDESIIGAPFYVMERVRGVIIRKAKAPDGHALDQTTMRGLCESMVDGLVDLHATDLELSGFEDLGKPDGYVARQVSGWTTRYQKSQTDKVSDMESVAEWLRANQPPSQSGAFIHNDYKLDNLVLDAEDLTQIESILDWEMATVGDPLMDLGTTLGYWVEASDPDSMKTSPFPPTFLAGSLSRQEVVERYSEKSGRDVAAPVFYYAYGLFKIAVIAQQIYRRFKDGHSKDPRFARMLFAVTLLAQTAAKAIDRDRIHNLA
ncbi:MAG: phosphotransferase family protein [Myxococcota bacterium]